LVIIFTLETSLSKTINISAPVSKVWETLTNPILIKLWMEDSNTDIEIITDWVVGSSFIIRGNLHGFNLENTGKVLQFDPEKVLKYDYLSNLSNYPDKPENYSAIEFRLEQKENRTELTFTQTNFITEVDYNHAKLYWYATLERMRRVIES
jgi:uncharacterized protein YndB with AHSA1/START domain